MPTILAIDDKFDNLVVIQAVLRQHMPDAHLIRATSGAEGIRAAKSERPDVILLDIIMPEMDGYETCQRLRADPATKSIPVVVLTAVHTDSEGRIKALESGADAFLTKPIESAELVAQIRAMLRIKFAEDKLRGERNLLEEAVAQTHDTIVITDRDLKVMFTNQAFQRNTGYKVDDVLGRELPHLNPDNLPESVQENILDSLGRGEAWTGALLNKRRDGSHYDAEATFSPIQGEDGSIIGYLMVERDVTARNRMEQQLHQAQKMEALGTLAGGIAHDFNNVLSVILGYTELASLDLDPDSELSGYMTEVMQAGQRARELISQILTFSRSQKHEKSPLQLKMIIKEVQKMLKASLPVTITVEVDIQSEGFIIADPTQMHSVIMNLCTNAYHAMQDTGGHLKMTLRDLEGVKIPPKLRDLAERLNHLSICDTGPGIQPEVAERIFEPYFTTKEKGEGTGLGLSIVHTIISDLHGHIDVESKPGKGTCFNIYLPMERLVAENEQDKQVYQVRHTGVRLMLVDDELPLIRMHTRLLGRLGYEVAGFSDPLEAIKHFEKDPSAIDVLITDLTMPGMNGLLLARTLRKRRADLRVLLVSGYFDHLREDMATTSNVCRILRKPISAENLAREIDRCLDENDETIIIDG